MRLFRDRLMVITGVNKGDPPTIGSDDWNSFPVGRSKRRGYLSVLVVLVVVVTAISIVHYIWTHAGPDETTLDRINGLSTICVAIVGVITGALAWVSLNTARRERIDRTRPIVFPVISYNGEQVHLVLINEGQGHARDVRFRTSPSIKASVGMPLEEHFRWKQPIGFLPTGGEIPIDIYGKDPQHILGKPGDQILTVQLCYRHGFTNDLYAETFPLNLDQYGYGWSVAPDGTQTYWGSRQRVPR